MTWINKFWECDLNHQIWDSFMHLWNCKLMDAWCNHCFGLNWLTFEKRWKRKMKLSAPIPACLQRQVKITLWIANQNILNLLESMNSSDRAYHVYHDKTKDWHFRWRISLPLTARQNQQQADLRWAARPQDLFIGVEFPEMTYDSLCVSPFHHIPMHSRLSALTHYLSAVGEGFLVRSISIQTKL